MRHLTFTDESSTQFDVAILIKPTSFNETEIIGNYVDTMVAKGIDRSKIIAFTVDYDDKGKASATVCKAYLEKLLPALAQLGVKHLYCADASYFKVLAKKTKADVFIGYPLPVAIKSFEYMQVYMGLNYSALVYNPNQYPKLDLSLETLCQNYFGKYSALGEGIIHHEDYPNTPQKVEWALNSMKNEPVLTCDTETFSLQFIKAGLGTIAFAWSKHEGLAFKVECTEHDDVIDGLYNKHDPNSPYAEEVKRSLRRFFESYQGRIIFHNAAYDLKVLIYTLWMRHPQDYTGMLHGLNVLTRHLDDTKLIAYLAINSTAGNELGLKVLAHDFAGNWAQSDINDIRKIEMGNLLRYNLVDCLSTFYVYEKYYPQMVHDKQEKLYKELFLPTLKVIIQMELHGMPIEASQVQKLKKELNEDKDKSLAILSSSPFIATAEKRVQLNELVKINEKLKTPKGIERVADYKFNPNSSHHLAVLLHDVMLLPVLERTPTKQPATGAEILEKLKNHTDDPEKIQVLEALYDLAKVDKIIAAFVPAFENATPKADGLSYLHGNFNLGGTVSGRLSSSGPNLQQIPSGSKYGKPVKRCFKAPKGFIFCGADYHSLEDYISALTTKDPNKLKIYLEGYCGHCVRALSYFGEEHMPDLVKAMAETDDPAMKVKIVNSIKKLYPKWRQKSKSPTFALTYQGTWSTLVKNCGFSPAVAKQIEAAYHKMYEVSDNWVKAKLKQACKDGYVEVAFGLRVRTPLLAQSVLGNSKTMREAEAEGRTAGNALGQSYGQLNNRAVVEFMSRVWDSPYKLDIMPVALIHDAIYLVIKDDIEVVKWANDNLIQCMEWQELPEIKHDKVKLGAELGLFHPDWSNEITLKNYISEAEILNVCRDGHKHYYEEHPEYLEAA